MKQMKTYFLFSDVVLMGLISSFTTLASIVLIAGVNARMKRVEKKQAENIAQIDGHMTTLIQTTADLNKAIGKKEGRDEKKAEMIPIIEEKVKAAKDAGKIEGIEETKNGTKS